MNQEKIDELNKTIESKLKIIKDIENGLSPEEKRALQVEVNNLMIDLENSLDEYVKELEAIQ